jgi:hypothetical protein
MCEAVKNKSDTITGAAGLGLRPGQRARGGGGGAWAEGAPVGQALLRLQRSRSDCRLPQ